MSVDAEVEYRNSEDDGIRLGEGREHHLRGGQLMGADFGNRWVRKVVNPGTANEEKTIFVQDGNQVALQFDRTGTGAATAANLSHRYLWGVAVDEILADETVDDGGAEDVLWTLTDHLNTVRNLAAYNPGTDTTTVANHLAYDAFGNVTDQSVPAVASLLLFTGRPFDPETGLQNNLNRWYDAAVGRWVSEDPIGFDGDDANLSAYCRNEPLVHVDPNGTNTWDYLKKLAGKHVYKAEGATAGGIAQLATWITDDVTIQAGAETGLFFFPDTCEYGLFSIKMGIVKALDPNGGPPKIAWEGGLQLGLGVNFEAALFTGPGAAGADSFKGIFYTGQIGGGPVGLSGYKGVPDNVGAYWYGGTVGTGVGLPLQVGTVAWNYQLITSYDLDDGHGWFLDELGHCQCLGLIQEML